MRKSSRENLVSKQATYQKKRYITDKMERLKEVILQKGINPEDLTNTLSKFKMASPSRSPKERRASIQNQQTGIRMKGSNIKAELIQMGTQPINEEQYKLLQMIR